MLPCEIRNGTPRRPKTPVLTANATGTTARPEMESPKNQCVMSTPGATKSRRVAPKATGGGAPAGAPAGGGAPPGAHEEQEGGAKGNRSRGFGDGPQGCEQGNGRNARQQDQGVRGSDAAGQSLPPVRRVVAGEVTGLHAGAQARGPVMVLRVAAP